MKHKFIKHTNNTDVCMKVLNYDEFDVFIEFWNMGQSQAYPIGETAKFPISKLYSGEWLYAPNAEDVLTQERSLRSADWKLLKI